MPWETEGDDIRVSGHLAETMNTIMIAWGDDTASGATDIAAGVYVTAMAVVLRELLLENLVGNADAGEFVEHISDALSEDEDGRLAISTFALLDEISEHISPDALKAWIESDNVRSAVIDLATTAFAE